MHEHLACLYPFDSIDRVNLLEMEQKKCCAVMVKCSCVTMSGKVDCFLNKYQCVQRSCKIFFREDSSKIFSTLISFLFCFVIVYFLHFFVCLFLSFFFSLSLSLTFFEFFCPRKLKNVSPFLFFSRGSSWSFENRKLVMEMYLNVEIWMICEDVCAAWFVIYFFSLLMGSTEIPLLPPSFLKFLFLLRAFNFLIFF